MNINNVEDLEIGACYYWPTELSKEAADTSTLMPLLETQDIFLSILKSADTTPFAWKDALALNSKLSANLFLKHLMVITDIGGERLQRFSKDFNKLFPDGVLTFNFKSSQHQYEFSKSSKLSKSWNNKKLNVEKSLLLKPTDITADMLDVCMLLIWGSNAINIPSDFPDEILEKCVIGDLIGKPTYLDAFVKSRYLMVSRQIGGSTANDLGYACESYVKRKLQDLLPTYFSFNGHHLSGVSQTDDEKLTKFDLVITNNNSGKRIGIEISFQVTTNSVIERKSQSANNRQKLAHEHGHLVGYIIDGSGNFQRKSAINKILRFSDCSVNFSDNGLVALSEFIKLNV